MKRCARTRTFWRCSGCWWRKCSPSTRPPWLPFPATPVCVCVCVCVCDKAFVFTRVCMHMFIACARRGLMHTHCGFKLQSKFATGHAFCSKHTLRLPSCCCCCCCCCLIGLYVSEDLSSGSTSWGRRGLEDRGAAGGAVLLAL